MCGIIGYAGRNNCVPYLLNGLERLEYRGYDSSGIAVMNEKIRTVKCKGKLDFLKERLNKTSPALSGFVGVGHTRWATHGKPSDLNSHPHSSESGLFTVVHNGIIENYALFKKQLIRDGVNFISETDTEVIAQLLEKEYDGDFLYTVKKVTDKLEGSFALAIMCSDFPDEIICAKKQSPLIVASCSEGTFTASDVTAVLSYTRKIYKLSDGEFARLKKDGAEFFTENLSPLKKEFEEITYDISSAEKGGYEHFMLKEIFEQPDVIKKTISSYLSGGKTKTELPAMLSEDYLKSVKRIYTVACGSAYHVGVTGKYIIEKLCRIPTEADIASEFRYREPIIDSDTLVIAVSQSGETADTLAAIRLARKEGAKVLSIVNVTGSAIACESDAVLYTRAGPEIAVATTKAYSCQLAVIYILALYISRIKGLLSQEDEEHIISELLSLPDKIDEILRNARETERLSDIFKNARHAYFIGRNTDYAAALEGSLKMKEISYIHSEAYGAGELKHGTISLIEKGTLVVALCACDSVFQKTVSNIKEVKARGATVICITTKKHEDEIPDADFLIALPDSSSLFTASLEVIPMQLLSYFTAKKRGCDIDKPRNLAKSVTVE